MFKFFNKRKKYLFVLNLALELTRKCNLCCKHCMRGPAENVDMTRETLEKIFDEVRFVQELYLAGGELMLVPEVLKMLIEVLKEKQVSVGSYKVFTNGTLYDEEFFENLQEIHDYVEDKEESAFIVSLDQFHKDAAEKFMDKEEYWANIAKINQHPLFTDFAMDCDVMVTEDGNAAALPDDVKTVVVPDECIPPLDLLYQVERNNLRYKVSTVNNIVVNVLGEIVTAQCYKEQHKTALGNVNDEMIDDIILRSPHIRCKKGTDMFNQAVYVRNSKCEVILKVARLAQLGLIGSEDSVKWIDEEERT